MSVYADDKKEATKKKAEPLEKKLDKRGLLELGYGYGINGLDVGYIGGGHHGGAYQHYEAAPYHYGHHSLGHKVDVHKTITKTVGVPVPYEVN